MALTPGTHLGGYDITAQIGEGEMGQVYRATDTAIHGLEETAGLTALVMELVEGEDLSQKLEGLRAKGSGLPLDEAPAIAKQIADALEAAHEQGIVHRDRLLLQDQRARQRRG